MDKIEALERKQLKSGKYISLLDLMPEAEFDEIMENRKKNCTGQIFRGKVNAFINSNGEYVYQERMVPLKKKSCPGCDLCGFLADDLRELIENEGLPIINNIEHGALYQLNIVNETTDWETGMIDDWDFEFVKVEE